MTDPATWLDQVREDTLEPDRPIIDPHHHLWRGEQPYDLPDLWSDTASGHRIIGTVFVECGAEYRADGPPALQPVGETEYVSAQAAASQRGKGRGNPPILGIVSYADLRLGAGVEDVIAAHADAASGLLRGIRHRTAYSADPLLDRYASRIPQLMMQPDFRDGFAQLAPAGLSYDAWLLHPQMGELIDLAQAFPETTIVLNHFGGPVGIGAYQGKRAEVFSQWKRDIAELARCDNVVAKLGGLAMPLNGWGWDERERPATSDEIAAAHSDFYSYTIDCFGPQRCMFESNFPVDKSSVSYGVLWNAFKKMASGYTAEEKDAMFCTTAARIYRLDMS